VAIPNAAGSPIAAAAAAAHDVLVSLFPGQQGMLDVLYTNYLNDQGLGGDPGVAIGQQAALGILTIRMNDGRSPSNPEMFFGGTGPGEWRSELATPQPMFGVWIGTVRPFTLKEPSQFRAGPPPPHLASGAYAKAYAEVKALGAVDSTARTDEQTAIAMFFSDTSIQYWNRILRDIASAYLTDDLGGQRSALRPGQPGDGRRRHHGLGTASGTGTSGGRSRPFTKVRTMGTRERRAIPTGSRSSRRRTILITRLAPTTLPARRAAF
jgi:hypothetical protein